MDVGPIGTTLAPDVGHGAIVVLRSFGKFYGLAGLRLGFALAAPDLINRIEAVLGPWAVAGPAIEIGKAALGDSEWRQQTLSRLTTDAKRLDELLAGAGLTVVGGTPLYRLTESSNAAEWFDRLGRAGILVRRFAEKPSWLRWGLPDNEHAWQRLTRTLTSR